MSVRTEKRFFIRCDADGCDREHHDPTATSAMEARVSAGRDGWQFQVAKDRGGPAALSADIHARLYPAIECVLIDHADELDDDHGRVDANLAELAHVYRELTGFDARTACQQEHPTAPTP